MESFFPGRVIVGPGLESGGAVSLARMLSEEVGGDFEYEFGVDDVLRQNKFDPHELGSKRALPFIGRVPEGTEIEMAARISRFSKLRVGAATPDYLVRPAAAITINDLALTRAIVAVGGIPGGPQ